MRQPDQKKARKTTEDLVELVRQAAAGNRTAFDRLLRRHRPEALRYARAILRDADLAEDVLQEAWLDCHHKLPGLKEPAAFVFWFRRIVFKQCDRLRRRREFGTRAIDPRELSELNLRPGHDLDPAADLARHEERRDMRRRLRRAYRTLTPAQRRLARLRFLREQSYAEISRELGIPIDTVKNRVRVLRRHLRFVLGPATRARTGFSVHSRLECRVLCA